MDDNGTAQHADNDITPREALGKDDSRPQYVRMQAGDIGGQHAESLQQQSATAASSGALAEQTTRQATNQPRQYSVYDQSQGQPLWPVTPQQPLYWGLNFTQQNAQHLFTNINDYMGLMATAPAAQSTGTYGQEMRSVQSAADPVQPAMMSLPFGPPKLQYSVNQAVHPSNHSMLAHHQSPFEVSSQERPQTLGAPQPHNASMFAYQQHQQLQPPLQQASPWDPFAALKAHDQAQQMNGFPRVDSGGRGNVQQPSTRSQPVAIMPRGPASSQGLPLTAAQDARGLQEQNNALSLQMIMAGLRPSSQQHVPGHPYQQRQPILGASLEHEQKESVSKWSVVPSEVHPQPWSARLEKNRIDKTLSASKSAAAAAALARRSKDGSVGLTASGPVEVRVRQRRRYRHENFPSKLYRILMEVERDFAHDIVSFTASGTAFSIHSADRFTKLILPKYFRHGRMASFKRQLSMYGFRRVTSGPDEGAFQHDLFRKGRPDLCQQLKRVTEFEIVPKILGDEAEGNVPSIPDASIKQKKDVWEGPTITDQPSKEGFELPTQAKVQPKQL